MNVFNQIGLKDSANYNCAASLAPILNFAVIFRFKFLKIVALHAMVLITLRAVSICNFFLIKDQMTVSATKFFFFQDNQEQVLMFTKCH